MRNARKWIVRGVVALAAAVALVLALMPRPVLVDIGQVQRGPLQIGRAHV